MGWYAQSDEPQEHLKECKKDSDTCEKCFEISEMAYAMQQYGRGEPHPLLKKTLEVFSGKLINEFGFEVKEDK